jgi:hypothetical protein
MALIDLKSNLKNLKFDKDTRGGGSSGQPYLKGGLPENSPAGEALADVVRFSKDYPLRGGASSLIFSTQDAIRVGRFLNDFPEGALFTSKQVGLQRSNPLMETGDRGTRFTLDGSSANINTQRYNLNANLLAQVVNQGNGIHIPRAGFNTNDLRDPKNKYEYIVKERNEQGLNRLEALYNTKIQENVLDPSVSSFMKERTGISDFNTELFNYPGGPGSSYGLGNTLIPRVTNTSTSYKNYIDNPKGFTNTKYNPTLTGESLTTKFNTFISNTPDPLFEEGLEINIFNTITETDVSFQQSSEDYIRPTTNITPLFSNTLKYDQLLAYKDFSGARPVLRDFRQFTDSYISSSYENSEVNITTRVNIGSPGSRTREQRKSINQINTNGQDKINLIPLYSSTGDPIQDNNVRDLIKFCIEIMDNDTLGSTVPLHFRAYITNFSDNIGATWNGQKYMGRGEDFYTYQGFTREVSFNLKVAAQSKQEMMPLYQKLNYLASSLHPDYNDSGFMRGNLHKLTIGEWFYRTPGILKSMNITVNDNYPWEIKYTEPETSKFNKSDFSTNVDPKNYKNGTTNGGTEPFQNSNSDADMMELPQILDISFTFTPILNNLPRLAKQGSSFTTGSILISDHGNNENFIKRITN